MRTGQRYDHLRLRLTCLVLAVVLLGLCVVRDKYTAWPVLQWPMYARREFAYPGKTDERMWLVVELADSSGGPTKDHRVEMKDLLPMGYDVAVREIVVDAFGDEGLLDARWTLLQMVRVRFVGQAVHALRGYRGVWAVEPASIPPLEQGEPIETMLIGRFEAAVIDRYEAGGGASP